MKCSSARQLSNAKLEEKKKKVLPAKAVISCTEKTDTLCGNLAPNGFFFADGHEGSITCAKTGKFETCTAKCADSSLSASIPTIFCKTIKRVTKFIPASAPEGIICSTPPPTKCGHFASSFTFEKGSSGSIGDCRQVGKNQVCKVTCDEELAPSLEEIQCRAAKKGKFNFFPKIAKISCKAPPPPLPKNVHAKCGDIFQVGPRYNLDEQSLSAECDKVKCVLSCKNAGATLKATPSKLPKNGEMIIKCGKKGFAPKKVKASCIDGSSQRAFGGLFDDKTADKQNNKTSCLNSIYEKYAVSPDSVNVNCTGNKCLVSCKNTGKPPRHVWPDGSSLPRSLFTCKGRFSWSPIRGRIVC